MTHTDQVKLMDSGTVLFQAGSLEEAVDRVRSLLAGGTLEEGAGGLLEADFSGIFYYSVITARVEACSMPDTYAASFQEANAGRFLPLPPSRKALARMERIKRTLAQIR
ncbi:MAG: hypothetical protein IJ156_05355 [Bacteroidales bacterium]|nr:hypothetical protein [Bacteroidales bacterium]